MRAPGSVVSPGSRPWQKGSVRFWIGVLISAVCLYLSFQGIRLEQVWAALGSAELSWFVIAAGCFAVSHLARVLRWRLLFYPRSVRFGNVFSALSIGYFLSNILPARLGDLGRAFLIGEKEKISKVSALGTVVVERVNDGLMIGLLLLLLLVIMPQLPEQVRIGGIVAAVGGIAFLAFLTVLTFRANAVKQFFQSWISKFGFIPVKRILGLLQSIFDGFEILRSPRAIVALVVWAIAIWIMVVLSDWAMMFALGIHLPITAAALVVVVTGLGVMIPSSPGYIGVFHYVTQQTLVQAYGIDPSVALSYAFLAHGLVYLSLTLLGVFFIWREGFSFRDLSKE